VKNKLILSTTSAFALFASACASSEHIGTEQAREAALEAEVNGFIGGFVKTWNAYDGAGIAKNYYRMGNSVEVQATNSQKMFDDLRKDGFKETVFRDRLVCITSPTNAHAPVKFERMKTGGTAMARGVRAITFDLTKFDDGLRATRLVQGDPTKPLSCATPLPPVAAAAAPAAPAAR
jgi:hypothetical protein